MATYLKATFSYSHCIAKQLFLKAKMIRYFCTAGVLLYQALSLSAGDIGSGMHFIDVCPKTQSEVDKASLRRGCGNDTYGHNQYMCLPHKEKTSLVEFCFNGVMGAENKGYCLEFSEGKLEYYNCQHFLNGCPETEFYDTEFFKYPECQRINKKHQCYVSDPSCGFGFSNGKKSTTHSITVLTSSIFGGLTVLILFCVAFICIWRKKTQKRKKEKYKNKDVQTSLNGAAETANENNIEDNAKVHKIISDKNADENAEAQVFINDKNADENAEAQVLINGSERQPSFNEDQSLINSFKTFLRDASSRSASVSSGSLVSSSSFSVYYSGPHASLHVEHAIRERDPVDLQF